MSQVLATATAMREALLAEGFKQFTQRCLGHESAIANYQKCIRDLLGKQYFVTVYEYDLSALPSMPPDMPNSFQFTAQFREGGADDSQCINVVLTGKRADELPEILRLIAAMWQATGQLYYDRF